jgi:predicted nuclease of predicted toxin-antitoxin system
MNISPRTVEALKEQDWDVVRVSQLLPRGAPDEEVLDLARRDDRILVTQDLDFSALLALGGHGRPSLVTIRLSVSDPETITRHLLEILPRMEQALREGHAITVEDRAIRVRRLPIE